MPRMTVKEARALYEEGVVPSEVVDYNPVDYEEEMQDVITGVAGLVATGVAKVMTGPQVGSRIPCVAIDVDVIRLFIGPEFKKITPRRIIFEAFTYAGRWERFDTDKMWIGDREAFIKEMTELSSSGYLRPRRRQNHHRPETTQSTTG